MYFVFVNLGANGDEILEKAIVLLSEANVTSSLFHPDILEANQRDPLVLVQQPDQPSLVGDELLDHPLPGARDGQGSAARRVKVLRCERSLEEEATQGCPQLDRTASDHCQVGRCQQRG